ncbi:MAG: hypothetical protein IIX68_08095 [Clostridia bacterium]|nr:hypothetical protein [Clostridia bacterium]
MTRKVLPNDWLTAIKLWLFSCKKNLSTAGLVTACLSLLCPGLLITEWLDTLHNYNFVYDGNDDAMSLMIAAAIFSCALALLLACFNFSYLYKKSAGDLFHALPLTRTQLLLSRYAACVVPALLPAAVNYLTLFLFAFDKKLELDLSMVACGLALTVAIVLCVTAFAMIFMVCCGNVFSALASFGAINLGAVAVLFIVDRLCDEFLYGYVSQMDNAYPYCSPVLYAGTRFMLLDETHGWKLWLHIGILLVLAIGFLALSCLLYNRRKSEKAGLAFALRWMRYPVMGMTAFVGCYLIGLLFDTQHGFLFFVFAAIGALLIALAVGAILDKGFKTAKRSLAVGGVSFALLFATFLCIGLDLFGYIDRIPAVDEIASVRYDDMYSGGITFTDPAAIRQLHKVILDDHAREVEPSEENYNYWYSVQITYTLKNGKTIARRYNDHGAAVYKQINAVLLSKAYREEIDKWVAASTDGPIYVGYRFEDETRYDYFDLELNKVASKRLLDLYFAEATVADLSYEKGDSLMINYYDKYYDGWHLSLPYSSKTFADVQAYLDELFIAQYPEKAAEYGLI